MMPSVSISVWIPRSRTPLSSNSEQTAFGIAPMPICRQAPSSISVAMSCATARSMSVGGGFVIAGGVGLEHGARPQRQARADLHFLELVDALGERAVEHVRLAYARAVLDPVAGADEPRGVGRGDSLRLRARGPRRSSRPVYCR